MKFKQAKQSGAKNEAAATSLGLAFSAIARAYDAPSDQPSVLPNEPDPGKSWYIEGFASTQDIDLSRYADPEIQPSGLRMTETSLQNLVDWTKNLSTVFKNHDLEDEIGRIVDAEVREGKMWVKILISKTRPDIWQRILEGVLNKFSVQFIPQTWHYEDDPMTGKPVRVVDTAVGLETSVVGLPMNHMADIAAAYAASFLSNLQKKSGAAGEKMDRTQLIEQIKAHLAQLTEPDVDAQIAGEIKANVASLYEALRIVDASIPDPLKMGAVEWEAAVADAEAQSAPAAEQAPEQAPAEEAPAAPAEQDAPAVEAASEAAVATAVAAAAEGAVDAEQAQMSPEAKQELVALGQAVGKVLGTVARGVIPMAAVVDMAYLEESLAAANVPEKAKAKTKSMLVDMFKVVADAVDTEKKSVATGELGSVMRSFEAQSQKLINQFQAALEESKKIAQQAAQAAAEAAALQKQNKELLQTIEKKSAEIQNLTVSGPNGPGATPPTTGPVNMNSRDERIKMWQLAGTPIAGK